MSQEEPPVSKCPVDHKNIPKDHPLYIQYQKHIEAKRLEQESASASSSATSVPGSSPEKKLQQASFADKQKNVSAESVSVFGTHGSPSSNPNYENMMSQNASPNTKVFDNQKVDLDKNREVSTIPMAGAYEGQNWVYPSEQMFYNAVKRKEEQGAYGTTPEKVSSSASASQKETSGVAATSARDVDMKYIVPIHNAVNEMCWGKILEWERAIQPSKEAQNMLKTASTLVPGTPDYSEFVCKPKLVKFQGRPKDYTPKALFRHYILGYKLPFDRHDWVVERCDDKVRYIIDFYTGKNDPSNLASPSFYIDARRDISFGGIVDRVTKFLATGSGLW